MDSTPKPVEPLPETASLSLPADSSLPLVDFSVSVDASSLVPNLPAALANSQPAASSLLSVDSSSPPDSSLLIDPSPLLADSSPLSTDSSLPPADPTPLPADSSPPPVDDDSSLPVESSHTAADSLLDDPTLPIDDSSLPVESSSAIADVTDEQLPDQSMDSAIAEPHSLQAQEAEVSELATDSIPQ